jgi:hypothetical protein
MKTLKNVNYTKALATVMPRQNGTPAGLAALQAALERGKELTK